MTKIFELEQGILNAWAVVDDLRILREAVLEKDLPPDEIDSCLLGLTSMYTLKFEKLFSTFEAFLEESRKKKNLP